MDTTTRRNRRAALAALLSGVLAATAAGLACAATPPTASSGQPVIVVLGDSLSAEYGLPRDTGWVALLRQRLATERIDYSVANASVSGDTTSGGRARLPAVLARLKPAIVVVELGANDALRGVPLATTERNLREIVADAQRARAKVVLVGMFVPPNYGPDYTQKFHGIYTRLSKDLGVPLVPFLLAGIENRPDMFQADQIHPTRQAQGVLLDNVWPSLRPLLGKPRG
ncbi:arylesterase [Burkholderia ubonensis]|uniref:arylesterase n=1 Tax=Burkholderia ubonensis TaxID=101571 RepID=UPI0007566522|nr:arylesterase [Burkholderia ubonensis]KVS43391.1 arylesterase [Burkholderia ubonensis]KVS48855.1 arylesterase [Burkholderia ubonensis]KVS77613.1 arylesterase [Burkholderia ubonensis]KVS83632.1 arylesterase [Burkholderia ubonensis]KVS88884.1 arylesterase [Burkholderia ubonensis]